MAFRRIKDLVAVKKLTSVTSKAAMAVQGEGSQLHPQVSIPKGSHPVGEHLRDLRLADVSSTEFKGIQQTMHPKVQ